MAAIMFDGSGEFREFQHDPSFAVADGTIAVVFTADDVAGRRTLFSKDAKGIGAGGDITAMIRDGRVEVRLEGLQQTVTLRTESSSIVAGRDYDVAVTFGASGFRLYLDGVLHDWRPDFTTGLEANDRNFVIGANTDARDARYPDRTRDYFDGTIESLAWYGRALTRAEIAAIDTPATSAGPTQGTTGTGLDQLVDIILADRGLAKNIPATEIAAGAQAANGMNVIIVDAIRQTGVANDGTLNVADLRDVNAYLRANYAATWIDLHGDDEAGSETGFHLVQNDGARTYLFGDDNAVNTIADGIFHLGFAIAGGRLLNEDGDANASLKDVSFWLNELLAADLAKGTLANGLVDLTVPGSTKTGLDALTEIILVDPGLNRNISTTEIVVGARGADAMNVLIVEAIRATGVANDRTFTAGDVRDVNAYLQRHHAIAWVELHGDDEEGEETGFHLVQNDGASTYVFGDENAVNTVADGIYHLGFAIRDGRLLNEDAAANASLKDLAFWLNEFLAADLAAGTLANNAIDVTADATTGTGLDSLVQLIITDPRLQKNIPTSELVDGAEAADAMNVLIVEAIRATGVANDGEIGVVDVREINAYLRAKHTATWISLHGDDEDGSETGFHLVQNDGASTYLFGDENAVNTVADGIYHLGFEIRNDRLLNEDGDANATLRDVAYWLNELLAADLAGESLDNASLAPDAAAIASASVLTQGTVTVEAGGGFVEIAHAPSLALANGTIGFSFVADTVTGARTLFSKDAKGFGAGGHLAALVREGRVEVQLQTTSQTVTLRTESKSIRAGQSYHVAVSFGAAGLRLYLDGELVASRVDVTTGLANNRENLVVGAGTSLRDVRNPTRTSDYFDGTIEGFTVYGRALTRAEIGLVAPDRTPGPTAGASATGLDRIVDIIRNDSGLANSIPSSEIVAGSQAANGMNALIVAAIRATGVANDGTLNAADVREINAHLRAKHAAEWRELHGDDAEGLETGFHLVQNDGATTRLFGDDNAVNTVADGIYHLGFEICGDHLLNEDGNANASLQDVAFWLSEFLADDLAVGSLANAAVEVPVEGTTDTGLDQLIAIVMSDRGLNRNVATGEIAAGARAADGMNTIIVAAIRATGIANDGTLDAADIRELNQYVRAHYRAEWVVLHGDDENGEETGFHLVQNDGAVSQRFGDDNAVNTVADGIYHLGFEICGDHLLNEDGNANASLRDVAFWLNELLAADLASGSLANLEVTVMAVGTTGTGLDQIVRMIAEDTGLRRNIPSSEIFTGAMAGDSMNHFIFEAIHATGVANDGVIDHWDVRDINAYIRAHHAEVWAQLHGDDEDGEETGFHLVQNDGARTQWFGDDNAVDTIADGLYHLGFGISGTRLLNEDGNANASLRDVAYWLDELLAADFATGKLVNEALQPNVDAIVADRVFSFTNLPGS
jgi:hypothetical protein